MPGECWAFEGSFAQVTLHLATKVKVTGFSIEHSPKELALHGHIASAPKQFSVWVSNKNKLKLKCVFKDISCFHII